MTPSPRDHNCLWRAGHRTPARRRTAAPVGAGLHAWAPSKAPSPPTRPCPIIGRLSDIARRYVGGRGKLSHAIQRAPPAQGARLDTRVRV